MVPGMGDISAGNSPATIPTVTGAAVSEGTHHAPHPATVAGHTALQLMGTPIATHAMTPPTSIVTPHPALNTSPMDITHTTTPWTRAVLTPATPTTLHGNHNQEKLSYIQDLQPPINPIIPRLSLARIPLQILPQIQTATLIL